MKSIVITYLLFITLLVSQVLISSSVYANESEKIITTFPNGILFDLENIKPGDNFKRELIVKNKYESKINYSAYVKQVNGDEMLFNVLNAEVINNDKTFFKGKLTDLNSIRDIELNSGNNDRYLIVISFPKESGNEYQGLTTEFEIVFTTEGDESTVNPPITTPTNGGLPQTGESNPIWYYLSGIMLAGVGVGILRQSLKGDRPRIRLKR